MRASRTKASPDASPPELTTFSFGYWGWGGSPEKLVETVDAIERERGFQPPVFVDVRIRRQARPAVFCSNHFEQLVGVERYRWIPGLGNLCVKEGREGVEIADPDAAKELLAVVQKADKERRRALFYCACEMRAFCHRDQVAELLLHAAGRQKVPLTVVEWPGTAATIVDLRVPSVVRAFAKKGLAMPDEPRGADDSGPEGFASLGWGSVLRLQDDREQGAVLVGPARFVAGRWWIPFLGEGVLGRLTKAKGEAASAEHRREYHLEPERSG